VHRRSEAQRQAILRDDAEKKKIKRKTFVQQQRTKREASKKWRASTSQRANEPKEDTTTNERNTAVVVVVGRSSFELKALHAEAAGVAGLGGFGGLFDLKAAGFDDPVLVAATDGVGTKLRIAIDTGHVDTIGIDLVAMCVNDLICQGAEPLFFLDYFATGALEVEQAARIVEGIAEGCRLSGCALIGGETAEMPGMYAAGDFDLAGFAVGAMERGRELPRDVSEGDVLLGLTSDGVHSNGYSLVRKIVELSDLGWDADCPWGEGKLGEALLTPTRLYVLSALAAVQAGGVKGLAHITGGGLTENLPRVLPDGLGADVDLNAWSLPPVFAWLAEVGGIAEAEMLKIFNAGIGLVLVVDPEEAEARTEELEATGERVIQLGHVTSGEGVRYRGQLL